LDSIKKNTPVDHVVNLTVGKSVREDKIGEIVAQARTIYDRSGLVISVADAELGYNGAVMDVLRTSEFTYTVVCPATHRIEDKSWFGKMQQPLIKVPACGMTFAFDDMAANTRQSHPWDWRHKVPSKFFMIGRDALGTVKNAPHDLDGNDIATAVRDHLRTAAAPCWAVPSCRISKYDGEW
jgi:hypothetical protein